MTADAKRARETLPPPGALVGERYRLRREIAAGGMGAVYEALDEREGRAVAIKLLRPELTQERDVRRRFRRESSLLMAFDHPSIVRVLDVGADDESLLYTVMELLTGETLLDRLTRDRTLRPDVLGPYVAGIASGLSAAHERGVIHGDLKPANVFLLRGTDDVKLLDFGLSKVLGLERLTQTGDLIGTPAYMAPELLTGKGELDERIDTYAFGVLLYQCLSGRAPFTGRIPGKLMMDIVMGNATPLSERCPALAGDVVAVVEQAMSRQPELRFSSAVALARAFETAISA